MSLSKIMDRAGKFVINNSPTILTTIGVTGALTTAYLTGRASFKAAEILARSEELVEELRQDSQEEVPDLTFKDKFEISWKLYIPAAGTAILTVSAIIMANRIGNRRAAALAAAYTLSEQIFAEYKDKVLEKMGETKERKVRDEIAQDRVNKNPVRTSQIIVTGKGDVLCYDSYTGRYFKSTVEDLRKAQNELNHIVLSSYYASLTDFYNLIGLPPTAFSDDVGWNSDELLELEFSATLSEEETPCIVVGFSVSPIRQFHRLQ